MKKGTVVIILIISPFILSPRCSYFFVCVCSSHACVYECSHVAYSGSCMPIRVCICGIYMEVRCQCLPLSVLCFFSFPFLFACFCLFWSRPSHWTQSFLISLVFSQLEMRIPQPCPGEAGVIGRPPHPPCIYVELRVSPLHTKYGIHWIIFLALNLCSFSRLTTGCVPVNNWLDVTMPENKVCRICQDSCILSSLPSLASPVTFLLYWHGSSDVTQICLLS